MNIRSLLFCIAILTSTWTTMGTARAQGEPLLAEIKLFAGNFAPREWAYCDGKIIDIRSNQALFSLLGTTYGGDGQSTFGLPDLRDAEVALRKDKSNASSGPRYIISTAGTFPTRSGGRVVTAAMLGSVRIFAATFVPSGWAACDGTLLPIPQYSSLFSLVDTRYGGNGITQFGLPNLLEAEEQLKPNKAAKTARTPKYIICTVGVYPSPN